jgi:CDP-paratose 2-epimerase
MGRILITGGAGFLGVNAASHFAGLGWQVRLLDNLSRANTDRNLEWIRRTQPKAVEFIRADVRNRAALDKAVERQDAVLHLAAQVAVTTSVQDPTADFEINAGGTVNLLEAVRTHAPEAAVVYASTNKVYGELTNTRRPVDERQPLDFHSPYGCSKGAADQYVRDYARCYGLRTVVFRQSCIYGEHQYGTEDQGWVAHFVHSISARRRLTVYGDGSQVRDLLDARDLSRLYATAIERMDDCRGQVFNVGGGPSNARSVLEVIKAIEGVAGIKASYAVGDWRVGDQRYFVCDIGQVQSVLGWHPEIGFDAGLNALVKWAASTAAAGRAA